MKQYLFNLLPSWIKRYKHSDKVAHAIYGVIIYLCLTFALPNHWALLITYTIAFVIEIKDSITHRGDYFDFLATIILPSILYAINP